MLEIGRYNELEVKKLSHRGRTCSQSWARYCCRGDMSLLVCNRGTGCGFSSISIPKTG